MATSRVTPRTLLLAALTVAAAVVLVAIWPRGTADIPGSSPLGPRDTPAGAGTDPAVPPALGLEDMDAARAAPANRRDLFRLGSAAPDPQPGLEGGQGTPGGTAPVGGRRGAPTPPPAAIEMPPVDPGPPPITLRFVGLTQTAKGVVASLSDGKFVYNAREGEIVEGRWRIVKIGAESLVIERVDGTGRQTLRGPG